MAGRMSEEQLVEISKIYNSMNENADSRAFDLCEVPVIENSPSEADFKKVRRSPRQEAELKRYIFEHASIAQ